MIGAQQSRVVGPAAQADEWVRSARSGLDGGRLEEAERWLEAALALAPAHAAARCQLGRLRERQGDCAAAIAEYRAALALDPSLAEARRSLAALLVALGRTEESLPLWRAEHAAGEEGLAFVRRLVARALGARDLPLAGRYASVAAELRWGRASLDDLAADRGRTPSLPLSLPKLGHDIRQFRYLRETGAFGAELDAVVEAYERVRDLVSAQGPDARAAIGGEEHRLIRGIYNRLLHVRPAERVARALSGAWDAEAAERQYLDNRPGLVVVDDFLSPGALAGIRRFCLESTVWFHNRYAHGRLGAFFEDGFNCPLLLQIAEELRAALPRVIGARYPLRQIWGFKNAEPLPAGVSTHADFAVVNVNFWITPESANLDGATGGMEVYDLDAPAHWDFETYNGSDMIAPFLRRRNARSVYVPYRQNRAIIFNSDLFHGTAAVSFRPEYENHRINVTMLYGDRQDDMHHRRLSEDGAPGVVRAGAARGLRKARR